MRRLNSAIVALKSLFDSGAASDATAHNRKARYTAIAAGIGAALLLAMFAAFRPAFIARLDNATYDSLLRFMPGSTPSEQVVIVDVDERSLSDVGQWPWPRSRIADLVTNLRDLGASVVGMDIIFAEAGRPRQSRLNHDDLGGDDELARALRRGRVVLGYAMTFDAVASGKRPCGATALRVPIVGSRHAANDSPLFRATGAVCNLAALSAAAGTSGFLNAAPDRDGILRRAPLLLDYDGAIFPSLALTTVNALNKSAVSAVRMSNEQAGWITLTDGTEIPVDGRGNLLLHYRGKKGTFRYVSAIDVLNKKVPDATFQNKLVLVGTTALGVREVVATPLDTLFAGIEVQATIADNLLAHDFIRRPESSAIFEAVLTLAFGIVLTIVMIDGSFMSVALIGVAGIAVLWLGTTGLLFLTGIYLSPLCATLALPITFALVIPLHARLDQKRADHEGHLRITAQQFMVQSLLSLTETRSAETGRHSRRTQALMRLLAEELAKHPDYRAYLTPNQIELVSSLAPLHDIGKVGVPDSILNKPGSLNEAEIAVMKRHPAYGRDVIRSAEERVGVKDDAILAIAKEIAYTHHERWDGRGYPEGLRSSQIPITGRLMAVVDVYDATANRNNPYRPRMTHDESVTLITDGRGAHFDPAVVEAFLVVAPEFERISRQLSEDPAELQKVG